MMAYMTTKVQICNTTRSQTALVDVRQAECPLPAHTSQP
jgi:hypothetical protein